MIKELSESFSANTQKQKYNLKKNLNLFTYNINNPINRINVSYTPNEKKLNESNIDDNDIIIKKKKSKNSLTKIPSNNKKINLYNPKKKQVKKNNSYIIYTKDGNQIINSDLKENYSQLLNKTEENLNNNKIDLNKIKILSYKNSNKESRSRRTKSLNLNSINQYNLNMFLDSIDKKKPIKNENNEDFLEKDIKNFETVISYIKSEGFDKLQNEINEKKLIKDYLENSVNTLKSKISLYKMSKKNYSIQNAKKEVELNNLKCVNDRYFQIINEINFYQNEIPEIQPQINMLNTETIQINSYILQKKEEINLLNDNIQKLNFGINEIKKERDILRPAVNLLNKHIENLKHKIKVLDTSKSYFMLDITNFAKNNI